ncbi:indole-3-glycerol phosphate synthase [Clostridium acidisoli DSM 12555]|uniref:Indole-3-glycerol phosphate synthase n=1 Tax=Clostridium acidisoli DSM 12555 TaxID=1121291 RepID=A0A1W1XMM0_9CLOT|nr:indole-3-glycerol phosphate synthase TrpC [Clostridium acidisoli]SMC25067.1 indole-3-glycerol phosphate synthase [Clostridium acidisoli DSM 12555]
MILDEIVSYKMKQLKEEKENQPLYKFEHKIIDINTRNFRESLSKDGMSIIAEIKKASPSKGIIKKDFNPEVIANIYEKINIDAISVLTEKKFFKGKDEYIRLVKGVTTKPILRKDFIIDEYQIFQAKYIGADAILLIVSILKNKLKSFYKLAEELGLQCIVEVHDRAELEIALEAEVQIIGINNRNLKDFTVNLKNTEALIKYIPEEKIIISESGIQTSEDILYLNSIGANAVLIGETFMRNIEDIKSINDFISKAKGE